MTWYLMNPVACTLQSRQDRVQRIQWAVSSTYQQIVRIPTFAENIAYPNGVAISADGQRVYISEFGKNRILSVPSKNAKESPEIPFVFGQFEGGIGPDGLAVDAEGNFM